MRHFRRGHPDRTDAGCDEPIGRQPVQVIQRLAPSFNFPRTTIADDARTVMVSGYDRIQIQTKSPA